MKTILLAEDSEDDVFFFNRALRQVDPACSVRVVINGLQVIDYLSGSGIYANRKFFPMPSIVILDLKLPCLNGIEALQWIRGQDEFRGLPVIMLTGSNEARDINGAYHLGVNSYFVKPSDPSKFTEMLRSIHQYWFEFGNLPTLQSSVSVTETTTELDAQPQPLHSGQMCGEE
ncbi:MAG: putative response regulator, CheY [Pedosphaera sp.]|nr:putative response regulator, CheY [Pedosphaera sp.]